jgi:hypothetical protein
MAKVGVKIGLTLKLSEKSQYEFIRPEVAIEGIETDQDIEAQLVQSKQAMLKTWETTVEVINDLVIKEMPYIEKGLADSIVKRLKIVEEQLKKMDITALKKELHA